MQQQQDHFTLKQISYLQNIRSESDVLKDMEVLAGE